jgi:DNA modification methylase
MDLKPMAKRPFRNRMNDLDPKEWIKFQKSWFVHDPPRRRKEVLKHPAKFPETLAQNFIEFFTKQGERVFDPMVGTGSTIIACLRSGRNSTGIELNPTYAEIARQLVEEERNKLGDAAAALQANVITGNASELDKFELPQFDYVITSPPYWDMLRARGAQTQRARRKSEALDVHYSDDPADLGNISDYEEFLERLVDIYVKLQPYLKPRGYVTGRTKKSGVRMTFD